MTSKFELGRDFCTTHLTEKFHHPTFNCSEVIVLTNRQTDKQTNRRRWKYPPRSAMPRRWVTSYNWFITQSLVSSPVSTGIITWHQRSSTAVYWLLVQSRNDYKAAIISIKTLRSDGMSTHLFDLIRFNALSRFATDDRLQVNHSRTSYPLDAELSTAPTSHQTLTQWNSLRSSVTSRLLCFRNVSIHNAQSSASICDSISFN